MCNSCYYNGSRKCMGTTPFTLENHSTTGCKKFSSQRQILPNWIRYVIAVLWLSKVHACMGTTPFTFENHSIAGCRKFSCETNSSKLDMMCNSTADCNKLSSLRPFFQIIVTDVVLGFSNFKVYGYNPMHLRKSQYSWLQQIHITEIDHSP